MYQNIFNVSVVILVIYLQVINRKNTRIIRKKAILRNLELKQRVLEHFKEHGECVNEELFTTKKWKNDLFENIKQEEKK